MGVIRSYADFKWFSLLFCNIYICSLMASDTFLDLNINYEFEAVYWFDCYSVGLAGCITTKDLRTVTHSLGKNPTKSFNTWLDRCQWDTINFPEFLYLMARNMMDTDSEEEIMHSSKVFGHPHKRGYASS